MDQIQADYCRNRQSCVLLITKYEGSILNAKTNPLPKQGVVFHLTALI